MSPLHVITVISNPVRYRSRYALYQNFKKHVACSGATLWTVEVAFGDRPFEVTEAGNPFHLQLRTFDEIWQKEAALDLLIQRLPLDWQYVSILDADISFNRSDWIEETVHLLQHYEVVQMFSHAVDLDPNYDIIKSHTGFMWSYFNNNMHVPKDHSWKKYGTWHSGYGWSYTRNAIDTMGGLIDFAILGAGDRHMATGLLGVIEDSVPPDISPRYLQELLTWQDHAKLLKKDVGYLPGTINHFFHGSKRNRFYEKRWQILTHNKYDPDTDIKKDWQGLPVLVGNKPRLRDQIRAYFRDRNEDDPTVHV